MQNERAKIIIFWSITTIILAVTFFLIGDTVLKNIRSVTKGPVHWHADFEVWNCGELVRLIPPKGISNKVGKSLLHEHGDQRIHIEGVIGELSDVSLAAFWESVGGKFTAETLVVPTQLGALELKNGANCASGEPAELRMTVYETKNERTVRRELSLEEAIRYVPSPENRVPPGACLIFEFTPKDSPPTSHLCEQYRIAK